MTYKKLTQNANSRYKLQAPAQNANSNGGDASRVGKICSYYLAGAVFPSFIYPDAGRVAPISACVSYQIDRLKSGFEATGRTVIPGNCALMGATY